MPERLLDVGRLLDPIAVGLLLLVIALVVWGRANARRPASRRARIGLRVAWVGCAVLYLTSCPLLADVVLHHLERYDDEVDAAFADAHDEPVALVVLAGGLRGLRGDVPPSELLDAPTAIRVFAAARIYRAHPFARVVVSGAPPELASGMADLLRRLGVPADRVIEENGSTNTRENAEKSAALLAPLGIHRAVVVTSAVHMPRSLRCFSNAGLRAWASPADIESYVHDDRFHVESLFPSYKAVVRNHSSVHEIVGRAAQALGR